MSHKQPTPTLPPKLPPAPPIPFADPTGRLKPMDDAQRVFDTVIGPNVRLRDNLIQLACVVVGTVAGVVGGRLYARDPDEAAGRMMIGALCGMAGSLLISGLIIGIIRWRGARRR